MFIRFDMIHERDRQQTDGRTDRETDTAGRHRPRLHSIARQNGISDIGCFRDVILSHYNCV